MTNQLLNSIEKEIIEDVTKIAPAEKLHIYAKHYITFF